MLCSLPNKSTIAAAVVLSFCTGYGCYRNTGRGVVIEASAEDFAPAFIQPVEEPPVVVKPGPELVLRSTAAPLRMLLSADWRDYRGFGYYPSIHVQFRAWNDDTTTAWTNLAADDFVPVQDTIVVHLDRLMVIDSQLGGANFSFRARLSSAGVQTDWVRLREAIRFYDRERPGIPRQPSELKLLP